MRVYGASPLYSYVELVFRSKRLFIVSVVLATLIVSTMATLRGGQYNAMAMILLTGKADTGYQSADASEAGTVKYKLNMLNIFLKDPDFMKRAIRDAMNEQTHPGSPDAHVWPETRLPVQYHFNTAMSEIALDKFCKDARQSITFAQGEGILELSCRWPGEGHIAEDIINAFFWEYHDQVVSYETTNSSLKEGLLRKLLADYKDREQAIEKKIIAYQQANKTHPAVDIGNATNTYAQSLRALDEMRFSIKVAQDQRDVYAQQLKSIPPKIVISEVQGTAKDNPNYMAALNKKNAAQENVDALKLKYQESHPKVKEAQAALDLANAEFAKVQKQSNSSTNLQSKTTAVNPDYVRTQAIVNQADAQLKGLNANLELKTKQAELEKQDANEAPVRNYAYKWLTDEYGIVGQIRTNLENQLQAAMLTQKQEHERSSAETTMVVKPVAELEASGGKSVLLYAAGPILGLIIAFAFSLVFETLDHSLRTPIEVEKHLGKPVLAVLPRMDPPKTARRKLPAVDDRKQATLPPV